MSEVLHDYHLVVGECEECCDPCAAPYPTKHLRFQQIAAAVQVLGFRGLQGTAEYYADAAVVAAPTRYGISIGQGTLSFTMSQPAPGERVMLFPYGSAEWNGFDVSDDIYGTYETNGWTSHSAASSNFWPANKSVQLSSPYSNGSATETPSVSPDPTFLDAFYWTDDITAAPSDTTRTWPGWSSIDYDGFGRLDTPVLNATAVTVTLSRPCTDAQWRIELAARLNALEFPLAQGEGHNAIVDRDATGAFITQRTSPGADSDVVETCAWCVAENINLTTLSYYLLTSGTALCPPYYVWENPEYLACRKAPPGPWMEETCDDHYRFFAFRYSGTIEIDGTDLEFGELGGPATQPAARRATKRVERQAYWAGRIRVTGMEPGEPYISRFRPQGGAGYTDTVGYVPESGILDVDAPAQDGFIQILPYPVP